MKRTTGFLTLLGLLFILPLHGETPFQGQRITPAGATTSSSITPTMPGIGQLPVDQLPTEAQGGPRQYRVMVGDTLSAIARIYLGDPNRYREIVELNNERYPWLAKNPDLIYPGMLMVLPPEPGTEGDSPTDTSVTTVLPDLPQSGLPPQPPTDSSTNRPPTTATPEVPPVTVSSSPQRLDNGGWIFAKLTSYAETGDWDKAEIALKYAREYRSRIDPSLHGVFDASYDKCLKYLIICETQALENELIILRQKTAAKDPKLQATIDWIQAHIDRLTRLGAADTHADLLSRARVAVAAAQRTVPRFGGPQPYLSQHNNQIDPAYTCQNTCIAMVLRNYGWQGNPDDITRRWGRAYGQTPAGIADIFNTLAREAGLKIRTRAHSAATMGQVDSWLAQGKQVIVQGWFTGGGHVIVLNKKAGSSYDCHDPNGTWSGGYKSGYSSHSGGNHVTYNGAALQNVIVEGGGVFAQELYTVDESAAPAPTAPPEPIAAAPVSELLSLQNLIPSMIPDVRYATTNNFTGQQVYDSDKLMLRRDAALALLKVAEHLEKTQGLRIKVFDAYRPLSVQKKFWEILPNPTYVADPKTGSRHNRGASVDLTLVDASGKDLDMGTEFDDFSDKSGWETRAISAEAASNRLTLRSAMGEFGFTPLDSEWWHFDFAALINAPILDIPIK